VNIVSGVRSIYAWEGKIERTDEVLMIIKTQSSRYDALETFIRAHHPYETPEIVEIPAGRVMPQYWQWIVKETTDALIGFRGLMLQRCLRIMTHF
jgi:periplasmic divalent cation tolerance protein